MKVKTMFSTLPSLQQNKDESGNSPNMWEQKNMLIKKDLILHLLNNHVSITISECSEVLHLSFPKSKKLIEELVVEGFLKEAGKSTSGGGRKAKVYEVVSDAAFFLGVEVKENKVRIGYINLKKEHVKNLMSYNFTLDNTLASLDTLVEHINKYIATNKLNKEKIWGIGIISPGRINTLEGRNKNYFNFLDEPLSEYIEKKVGVFTLIDNDTRAMTIAEYAHPKKYTEKDVLFVNVDYGLGLGIIIDGKIYYGKNGYSGEFGHTPTFQNGILCHCGKQGCLETEVSGRALERVIHQAIDEKKATQLNDVLATKKELSLEDIIQACNYGDTMVVEAMEEIGNKLGRSIANLINIFNPEAIVLGGQLSQTKDYLLLPIKKTINKLSLSIVNQETKLLIADDSHLLGVYGACLLVTKKILI